MTRADREDLTLFFFVVLLVCFLAPMARCQELPDNPVPNKQPECWCAVYRDGTVRSVPIDCNQASPAWCAFDMRTPKPDPGYWAFRRADQPYLRTNRQTVHSKLFWLPVSAATLATTGDVLVQRRNRQRQSPPPPTSGELYIDAYVPLAVGVGLDYVADRFVGRSLGTLVMGYITGKHVYGAVSGRYP